MIKLFWNTHNFKKETDSEKISTKLVRDYKWGIYHKKSSDKWIYEILGKIKYENIPILCDKFKVKKNLINPIYIS